MKYSIFFLLFFASSVSAQFYRVSGRVVNNKLEPLSFASIKVKGMVTGTVSKEDGTYELKLEEGKYELVFSMVGFKAQIILLVITKDYEQNIILEEEERNLEEAVVSTKARDRSVEIIRNVIRHKEELLAAAGAFSTSAYIKATQEDSLVARRKKNIVPDSIMQKNKEKSSLAAMAMAEIVLRYDQGDGKKQKEERTGVVKRGSTQGLFYLSVTEADFNLYNNLLHARSLSAVPFLSPISYSGLQAYKYKIIATTVSGKNKIYTISVKPRQMSNVTVEGELSILDSGWVITHARFRLPSYHLPEYDFFQVEQEYQFVESKAWMITRQEFIYFSKFGKGKMNGHTIVNYRDFELNKKFPPRYFGTELSATAQEAYERDSLFWERSRAEPLTAKEIKFIQYKDSVFRATHSKAYLDSIDRMINKVTWKKLVLQGLTFYNREKERNWYLPSLTSVYQPFQFGGGRVQLGATYSKRQKSRKNISVTGDISYGIRNHDINGNINLSRMYNPFNRAFYRVSAGRRFDYIFSGDAWINMLKRSNQYLSNAIGLGHGQEILNGLFLYTDVDAALRKSLENYKTNPDLDSIITWLNNNQAIAFEPYNAFYGKVRLSYTPEQRYIREPREKIILGSRWPTFYAEWRKGIPGVFNSKVDFDYLEFGIEQELKLGTTGISKYSIKTGRFLNNKDLRVVDYKFQRRGDPIFFSNPHGSFQSLDSSFALFKQFYESHYVHEFNGSIINRVPFLKKLQLREMAGGGFLIAPEKDLKYVEVFAGLERVFKWPFDQLQKFKVGVYVVGSSANGKKNALEFKIGITGWDRGRNRWY